MRSLAFHAISSSVLNVVLLSICCTQATELHQTRREIETRTKMIKDYEEIIALHEKNKKLDREMIDLLKNHRGLN